MALTGSPAVAPAHMALSWLSLRFAQKVANHLDADWVRVWGVMSIMSTDELANLGTPDGWCALAEIVENIVGKSSAPCKFKVALH